VSSLDEILETFSFLDEGEERYRYIIELGKELSGLPDEAKVEANRVHGCQSRVWMVADVDDGVLDVRADSDAFIVRGLIKILLSIYEGKSPAEAAELDPKGVFEQIGLEQHLSMGRRNGLFSMVGRVQALAAAAQG
jgi:cysteine desulfuration protein SufE